MGWQVVNNHGSVEQTRGRVGWWVGSRWRGRRGVVGAGWWVGKVGVVGCSGRWAQALAR